MVECSTRITANERKRDVPTDALEEHRIASLSSENSGHGVKHAVPFAVTRFVEKEMMPINSTPGAAM
jgi:hypothetical protein